MSRLGLDYPTKWARGFKARTLRTLLHNYFLVPYTKYMSTLEVRGIENIKGSGPFVFAANHCSNLDTALVITALPPAIRRRLVVAAAMDSFFMDSRTAFKTVIMFNAIPIDRHKVNRRSAQLALELVTDRWNLLIFPEGGRTPDGDLQPFKGGAAYLAERTNATVIPTYIHDAGYLRGPKYAKAPKFTNVPNERRHHVTIAFGPVIRCEESENLRRFGARIEDEVKKLGRATSGDENYGVSHAGSA